VNKQKFVEILNNRNVVDYDDIQKIEALEKDYPYSQVLHTLSAIASYSQKSKNAKHKLNMAAVYSTDRSVLKELVLSIDTPVKSAEAPEFTKTSEDPVKTRTLPKSKVVQSKSSEIEETSPVVKEMGKPSQKAIVDAPTGRPGHLSSKEAEDLRQEVMKNLEDLRLIKNNFMKGLDSGSEGKKQVKKKSKKVAKENKKAVKGNQSVKSAKSPNPPEKVRRNKQKEPAAKITKKEQNKIIDRFIKEEPRIVKGNSKTLKKDQNDLSVHSVEFGEDLVSENLAKIMVKQGKMGKAIDIYKKLIWKYPQKKAYFASQIESIKEK